MKWFARLEYATGLNPKQFTEGELYELSDDGWNENYSFHGKPVRMNSLQGTDMVHVLSDDQGEPCNIWRHRFHDRSDKAQGSSED